MLGDYFVKISIRNKNESSIIDISAKKLDQFLAKMLRKTLIDLIKSNNVNIYINFSLVESLCPDILGIILAAHRVCAVNGGKISIYGLKSDMLLIFHIIQLDKYLNLYNNESDAINHENTLRKSRLRLVK